MPNFHKGDSEKKITITGAGGFIGANLCRYYLAKGWSVSAVHRKDGNTWRLPQHPQLKLFELDFKNQNDIQHFIEEQQPQVIMNLAAYGAYSNQTDAETIYHINMDAVRWILDSVRKVPGFRAFIHSGSSSEYGIHCSAPNEETPTCPDSHYSVSKIGATSLCQYYAEKYCVPTWILRLYAVYGPYEDPSRLIIKLLRCVSEKRLPPLVDPQISRDFIYIDDVCKAFDAVLKKSNELDRGQIFNIGSGIKTTLEDLISLIREVFQLNVQPEWGSMQSRSWDRADWYANPCKAKKLLDWKAETSLLEGLQKTMEWIQSHSETLIQSDAHSVIRAPSDAQTAQ